VTVLGHMKIGSAKTPEIWVGAAAVAGAGVVSPHSKEIFLISV